MSRDHTALHVMLGGGICGGFLGILAGALLGTIWGAVAGDIAWGLDGALLGGCAGAVAGAIYGALLGPPEAPLSRHAVPPQGGSDRPGDDQPDRRCSPIPVQGPERAPPAENRHLGV